jgi:GntR family transcriptional regulator, transcriptional repressor for pyruvate dehydrogenase complex
MSDPETETPTQHLFEPVATSRISSAIVDQIRELIGSGRLGVGDRLPSERELAEQFGVSRVTVRDALRSLEAVGLLRIKVGANGGAFLRAPSSADAGRGISDMLLMAHLSPDDVAEARLVLELNTVMLAVRRAEPEDIQALRAICERSASLVSRGEYDIHLSWDFHERLAAATHNPALEMIHHAFRGPLSLARARAREPASVSHRRTVEEHTELVDALEARDAERARTILAHHLVRATDLEDRLSSLGLPGLPED